LKLVTIATSAYSSINSLSSEEKTATKSNIESRAIGVSGRPTLLASEIEILLVKLIDAVEAKQDNLTLQQVNTKDLHKNIPNQDLCKGTLIFSPLCFTRLFPARDHKKKSLIPVGQVHLPCWLFGKIILLQLSLPNFDNSFFFIRQLPDLFLNFIFKVNISNFLKPKKSVTTLRKCNRLLFLLMITPQVAFNPK